MEKHGTVKWIIMQAEESGVMLSIVTIKDKR
jgi:hypothetical protein